MNNTAKWLLCISLILFMASCTFDYGEPETDGEEIPDLIMKNVTYVRVRGGYMQARFTAERTERFDIQGVMHLHYFTFEQFGERGEEVNAMGSAGFASVEIETNNIHMDNNVVIEVESEDIIIKTTQLHWLDEERLLFTGDYDEVNILQPNGTNFIGIGLRVDARRREWEFLGNVSGIFISDDDEDEEEEEYRERVVIEEPIEEEHREPVDWAEWENIWEDLK